MKFEFEYDLCGLTLNVTVSITSWVPDQRYSRALEEHVEIENVRHGNEEMFDIENISILDETLDELLKERSLQLYRSSNSELNNAVDRDYQEYKINQEFDQLISP